MATSMTVESVLGSIIQGHLECSICHTCYQEPKMLHCSHSFCLKCLQELKQSQHLNDDKVTCPLCQRETTLPEGGVDKLNTNYTLIALVQEVVKQEQLLQDEGSKVMCQACDESNEAISCCMDCGHYLCQECKKAHQRLAALRTHKVTSLAELSEAMMAKPVSTKSYISKCDSHPSQELCFYCNSCEQLICKICSSSGHKEPVHSFVNFKTAIDICLYRARELVSHVVKYNSANIATPILTNWESSRKRLNMMLAQTEQQISQKAEMELAKIRQKETQLLQQAQVAFRRKDKKLAELVFAEHTMGRVHGDMTEANQLDVLKIRQELLHDYKDVVKELTDHVGPELSFISFAENQTETELGYLLLEEKWELLSNSNITGELIASLSTNDVVVVNKGQQKLTKLSPDGKILHICPISQLQGEDPSAVELPVDFEVNKDDQFIVLFESNVKIFNKEYQFLHQFNPGREAETDGTPTCLAVDDNNLIAVGYKDKEQISLHNPDGSIIRALPAPMIDSYMTISNQQIIYTNSNKKWLMSVDYEGNIKFTVQIRKEEDPNCPYGVCCDKGGHIYTIVSGPEEQGAASALHQAPSGAVPMGFGFVYSSSVAALTPVLTPTYKAAVECYSPNGKLLRSISGDEIENNSRGITYTIDGKLVLTGVKSTLIYHRV